MRLLLASLLFCSAAFADCSGFDLAVDTMDKDGHHAIIIVPGFKSFQACVNAGNQAKQRFEGTVSYICVSKK